MQPPPTIAPPSSLPTSVKDIRAILVVAALSYLVNNVLKLDNIFSDVPDILRPLGGTFAIILWQFRIFGPSTIIVLAADLFTKPRLHKQAYWLAASGIALIVGIAISQALLRLREIQTSGIDFGPHPYQNLALGMLGNLLPWFLIIYLLIPFFHASSFGTSANYPSHIRLPLLLVYLITLPLLLSDIFTFLGFLTLRG